MEENGKDNYIDHASKASKATNKAMIFTTYMKSATDHHSCSGQESYGELNIPRPPKSYTCSFCKREFRSAQALGGHMNVHRREKAKLRQINPQYQTYLPFLHPQVLDHEYQNPNFIKTCFASKTSSFHHPSMFPPVTCNSPPFSDPCCFHMLCVSSSSAKFEAFRSRKSTDLIVDCTSHGQKEGVLSKLKAEAAGLVVNEPKFDDLDLELRL